MALEVILQNNGIEDVRWLCSLSESELDLLISLKNLAHQRAKAVRREALAKKFDLKMFRALGFILMEHLKEELKDASVVPGLVTSSSFLDRPPNDKIASMNVEELEEYVGVDRIKKLQLILTNE